MTCARQMMQTSVRAAYKLGRELWDLKTYLRRFMQRLSLQREGRLNNLSKTKKTLESRRLRRAYDRSGAACFSASLRLPRQPFDFSAGQLKGSAAAS
jgi:hypothetical protein